MRAAARIVTGFIGNMRIQILPPTNIFIMARRPGPEFAEVTWAFYRLGTKLAKV